MTKPWSTPTDNAGRCEGCDRPETVHMAQVAAPLIMTDGNGGTVKGTMWLCPDCMKKRNDRERGS